MGHTTVTTNSALFVSAPNLKSSRPSAQPRTAFGFQRGALVPTKVQLSRPTPGRLNLRTVVTASSSNLGDELNHRVQKPNISTNSLKSNHFQPKQATQQQNKIVPPKPGAAAGGWAFQRMITPQFDIAQKSKTNDDVPRDDKVAKQKQEDIATFESMLCDATYSQTIRHHMQSVPLDLVDSALINYLKEMHVRITHQEQKLISLINQQILDIDTYASLPRNKEKSRKIALVQHKQQLLNLNYKDVDLEDLFCQVQEKGNLLREWQANLEQAQTESDRSSLESIFHLPGQVEPIDAQEAMRSQKPSEVISQNQRMGEILSGVKGPNGKVKGDVIADGWGSIAKVQVDTKSGDIGTIERMETPEDTQFKNRYLKYLEQQFQSKEPSSEALNSFLALYTSGSYKHMGKDDQLQLRKRLISQLEKFKTSDLDEFAGISGKQYQTLKIQMFSMVAKLNQILGISDKTWEINNFKQVARNEEIVSKEQELQTKLRLKENLKIEGRDARFDDLDSYFQMIKKQHLQFFNSKLSGKINLKAELLHAQFLSLQQKNQIVKFHNIASESQFYGEKMFQYCQDLEETGVAPKGFSDQIYVLSVDWPLDFLMDQF